MTIDTRHFAIPASDGQQIRGAYWDSGKGPIGAFLHGLLSNAEGTKSMFLWEEAVKKGRSWIRFDMRGHGKSDGDFKEFKISRAIEDVKLVLSMFPDRPKILVGSSMGGWAGSQAALDATAGIAGLVLLAPAFGFIHQIFDAMSPEEQNQWQTNGYKTFESPEMEDDIILSYDAVIDSRLNTPFAAPVSYSHPTHIIHGKLDDLVPYKQSIAFQSHAASSVKLNIIDDGGHRLTDHIEKIIQALDQIWPEH